jgi:predicted hotdog family 3-hydroxylacyl-ACP dehydratase
MKTHIDIAALIPHQGSMCLLHEVISWDDHHIRCSAISHRDPQHPLRSAQGLLAVSGIEYGAQAIAVHGGLLAENPHAPRAGYLANAKDVSWSIAQLDTISDDLIVDAKKLISESGRSIYEFTLSAQEKILVQGRVAVVLEGESA